MRVHHLDCGTMHYPTAKMVTHVFAVETENGLVLVDAGYGLMDCIDPRRRIGPMRHVLKPQLDPGQSAARQVERLGFNRSDVRHIIVTHLDFDHIGGIADFPEAQIHTTAAEILGAITEPSRRERMRYRPAQWEHGPKLVGHSVEGEAWRGFASAKELTEIADGLVLVSLPGHSRGHACEAVDAGDEWLLHCGDAFYHRGAVDGAPRVPRMLSAMERFAALDWAKVVDNHARLIELSRRGEADLRIVCAHDPGHLDMFTNVVGGTAP